MAKRSKTPNNTNIIIFLTLYSILTTAVIVSLLSGINYTLELALGAVGSMTGALIGYLVTNLIYPRDSIAQVNFNTDIRELNNSVISEIEKIAAKVEASVKSSDMKVSSHSERLELGYQSKLYNDLIDWVKSRKKAPNRIILIHHSGFLLLGDVLDDLMNLDTDIYLYQQDPEICETLNLGKSNDCRKRASSVADEMARREKNNRLYKTFKACLHIKQFRSPSSIRAMLVDDEALIISWYIYSQVNGKTNLRGSENPGILLYKGSPEFNSFYIMLDNLQKSLDQECDLEGRPQVNSRLVIKYNSKEVK